MSVRLFRRANLAGNYIVLGALLEKVTGKKYAALVRERVIAPLGLKSWGVFGKGKGDADQNPATYGATWGQPGC